MIANPTLAWYISLNSIQTTQVPACGHSATLTSTATVPFITPTFWGFGIDYFVQSNNLLDAGVHTVTVKSTITNYPTISCQSTFKVTMVDACLTTLLTAPTLTLMTTSVLKESTPGGSPFYETQTATATNTASVAQNNPNLCGSYQYLISSAPNAPATALSATELTIDATTSLIYLYTANSASVGTHTATVTAKLLNYPLIPQVISTFQISIWACLLTSYTMSALSPVQDKSYTIANPTLTWSIPNTSIQTTQVPACGHSETLTSTATVPFITPTMSGNGLDYSVQSNNLLDAGVYTVTVTTTIAN
jgi:hypothetical protein